jgi:hypothetical protein
MVRHGVATLVIVFACASAEARSLVAAPQDQDSASIPSFLPLPAPFSLGQPPWPRGRWGALLGYAGDRDVMSGRLYGNLSGRFPLVPRLDVTAEGAFGFAGTQFNAALGAYLGLPWFKLGAEYDIADGSLPFSMVLEFGLIRGGLLQRGDMVRLDYRPARQEVMLGASLRFPGQRYRNSRPRSWRVDLPVADPAAQVSPAPAADSLPDDWMDRLTRIEHAMEWMDRLLTPRFAAGEEFEASAHEIREHVRRAGHSFTGEDSVYHAELDRLFTAIVGGRGETGVILARGAERALLDQIVVPFNRLFGQWKSPPDAGPYVPFAIDAFGHFLDDLPQLRDLPADEADIARSRCMYVFIRLARQVAQVSTAARERWEQRVILWRRYGELAWLPLNYGLRPEDYDTQAEWDSIHDLLTGRTLTTGNTVKYLMSEQFHVELKRMIRETEHYQVTVVHDFRGADPDGSTDIYGWDMVVDGYMEAFIRAIRDLDAGRRSTLPQFFLILDDHYYLENKSRHIMTYLEDLWRPGQPDIADPEIREQVLRAQDRLHRTVLESRSLAGLDRNELRDLLRVHVNITNLFDPTSLFDNFMRDHRKFALRDVFEEDPESGVAIFTGQGVGAHYNGSGWEDRSILVRGVSLVQVKEDVRVLLLRQGVKPDEIPEYLRARPFPEHYAEDCARLHAMGWTTPVRMTVNETGYGAKLSSVERAATYNLAPKGSRILSFDSLWLSEFWAGMFVSAALRGAGMFPVAPTPVNAPSNADATMTFLRENLDRMFRAGHYFSDEIRKSGGVLRVGLYARDVPVDDMRRRIEIFHDGIEQKPILREVFNLDSTVVRKIHEAEIMFDSIPLVALRLRANPLLHMKNQLFGTREAFQAFELTEWTPVVREYLQVRREQMNGELTPGITPSILKVRDSMSGWSLEDAHTDLLRNGGFDPQAEQRAIWMWTIGSMNQSFRSIALDGESLVTVTGHTALVSAIDFIFIMAIAEWPETQADFDGWFPPRNGGIRLPHYELIRSLF